MVFILIYNTIDYHIVLQHYNGCSIVDKCFDDPMSLLHPDSTRICLALACRVNIESLHAKNAVHEMAAVPCELHSLWTDRSLSMDASGIGYNYAV